MSLPHLPGYPGYLTGQHGHKPSRICFRTSAPLSGYKLNRQRAIAKVLKTPKEKQLAALVRIVRDEVLDCDAHFKPFHSAHEAYGVMLEEFDELWDEIKKNQSSRDYDAMAKEAVQVAAMAIRLLRDICCDQKRGHEKLSGPAARIVDMVKSSERFFDQVRRNTRMKRKKRAERAEELRLRRKSLDRAWKTVNRVVYRKSRARS